MPASAAGRTGGFGARSPSPSTDRHSRPGLSRAPAAAAAETRPGCPAGSGQIPEGEEIASVAADGACDTRGCRDAVANRGADAVIPPRRNAKPWNKDSPGEAGRSEALRAIERRGRTIWRRWSGYHRQSRAKTQMNRRTLPGQTLRARDVTRQTAEVQQRIAIPTRYTALGLPVTNPVVRAAWGKGDPQPPDVPGNGAAALP